jgi:ABC-type sugar transport system ATPase subunit
MDIHVSGLQFGYGAGLVLDIPELHIEAGRVTALLGPNGAGKSSLLRLIAGLERPLRGSVSIGGRTIKHARSAAPLVAFGFQESVFVSGSIRQNLELALRMRGLPPAERRHRIAELAPACGLDGLLQRNADHVSVGEARRASLARALVLRAPVTLLDEPLAALDSPTRESLLDTLPHLLAEHATTTVLVTHDRTEAARLADDIVILVGGQVKLAAPRQAAFSNPPDAETAAFFGYHLVESEGATLAVAPGSLQPGPGEVTFAMTVEAVLRAPSGHEVLGAIGHTRIAIALPLGAAIPDAGSVITVSAPTSSVLRYQGPSVALQAPGFR